MKKATFVSTVFILFLVISVMCYAQGNGKSNRNGQGFGFFGDFSDFSEVMDNGKFDIKKFENRIQSRMVRMIKNDLKITDEEWTIIGPRMNRVIDLTNNNNARLATFRKMSRKWYTDSGITIKAYDQEDKNPVETASDNLEKLVKNETATTEEIKEALTKLRAAREATQQELVKAQEELKEVLTIKQEAKLVMYGILE